MSTELVVPRTVPLVLGAVYQLIPSLGGQYVVLAKLDKRYAYAKGYELNTADFRVRKYRWPEIVIKMVGQSSTDFALRLSGEDGYVRLIDGGRISIYPTEV